MKILTFSKLRSAPFLKNPRVSPHLDGFPSLPHRNPSPKREKLQKFCLAEDRYVSGATLMTPKNHDIGNRLKDSILNSKFKLPFETLAKPYVKVLDD